MKSTKLIALLLVAVMCFGVLASCGGNKNPGGTPDGPSDGPVVVPGGDEAVNPYKQAEYNTYTSTMPSNWNEMTYQDNNDTQILSYITSSFFDYDYKFDGDKYLADGSINADAIVEGAYTTNYSAATKLEDVTASVDAKWGYTAEQIKEGGYAWKITLRSDLKWDDGTPITAADFIYSMQQQLDPAFMNYRGNLYYDTLRIKNSKGYFFQNQEGTYNPVGSKYESNEAALAAGVTLYVDIHSLWGAAGYKDAAGNEAPQWVTITDETVYASADGSDSISGAALWGGYSSILGVGGDYESYVAIFEINTIRDVKWEEVGMYEVEGENAFVICLDKSYSLLAKDGSLSVWAPYYMSSLPLVHKAKYEANKHEPAEGATLWTSTYNSDLASTASWGPYMLTEYVAGSHYKLEKNPNWYGWNMEEYKNQYNITAVNCRKVEEPTTQWLGFLNGAYDGASLTTENYDDYKDSKYVTYQTETGTFGMQLYSNLSVLKGSENNNGILAIQEFRHAFNLALNRTDIVEKIWPGSTVPCFGLLNNMYFYDIENSPYLDDGGIYRNTVEAKQGILRAYGFTESNGLWSNGTLNNLSLDDAYDSLTGYNMTLAKQKMAEAIAILEADAEYYGYDASKNITIVYGSSVDTDKQRFRCDYLQGVINELTVGTSLEGKIVLVFDASAGDGWADAFRNGDTQIGFGYGFSGNAFNPFDIIGAFVNPDDNLNYHTYWDTATINMTLTMPAGDYIGAGETLTMSLQNWYYCLNGLATEYEQPVQYNFDAGQAPANARLTILSALEEIVLKESRSVMLIGDAGGSFLGAKFSYVNYDYNTFMGYGGFRYMIVEYTDAEWAAFVAANGNDLANVYKQSE